MSLTAREWLLLPKQEQQRRGKELSSEECFKLRMDLSEIHFTEEEKMKMTDEEKEKDEWSWDDEDPVADKADFLYSYKLAADVLQKKRL